MYTEKELIEAAKYGYEYHQTTKFPERPFEEECINNFKQSLVSKKTDELREIMEIYKNGSNKIFEAFGIKKAYGELDFKLDFKWNSTLKVGDSLMWLENGIGYDNEIVGEPKFTEKYMLVCIDNGCNEQYYQVFDIFLKDETIENNW